MKRVIVTPTALDGAPLDELKRWLSITTDRDDALLVELLRSSLDACEAFTGLMPLQQLCTEVLPVTGQTQRASIAPVTTLHEIHEVTPSLAKRDIAASAYTHEIDADGRLFVRLLNLPANARIELRVTAGLADSWVRLEPTLRQGIVRLAAHQYRERDEGSNEARPPVSVAALWRPWRTVRL